MVILVKAEDIDTLNLNPYSLFCRKLIDKLQEKILLKFVNFNDSFKNLKEYYPHSIIHEGNFISNALILSSDFAHSKWLYRNSVALLKEANLVFSKKLNHQDSLLRALTPYGKKLVLNKFTLDHLISKFPLLHSFLETPKYELTERNIDTPITYCWSINFIEYKYLHLLNLLIANKFPVKKIEETISFTGPTNFVVSSPGVFLHLSDYFDEHFLATLCDVGFNILTVSPIVKKIFTNAVLLEKSINIIDSITECQKIDRVIYPKFDDNYFNTLADKLIIDLTD